MIISSGLAADLLSVHQKSVGSPSEVCWKSIRKVRWTDKSDQKCPDKQWKLTRKLQDLHNRKISILIAQSLTESSRSPLRKAVAA